MKATKDEMLDLNKPTPTKPSGSFKESHEKQMTIP
jgi:hypothetical protein